jgi:hypothetical protein
MDIVASQGMIVVAAAGNDGQRGIFYPARNRVAVCVGASDMDNQRKSWSNYGAAIREYGVLAPGDWILAASRDGKWKRVAGTSIATPHVTGVIALLLEANCDKRELVRRFVFEGASQFEAPDESSGHGVVNARRSLDLMMRYDY